MIPSFDRHETWYTDRTALSLPDKKRIVVIEQKLAELFKKGRTTKLPLPPKINFCSISRTPIKLISEDSSRREKHNERRIITLAQKLTELFKKGRRAGYSNCCKST